MSKITTITIAALLMSMVPSGAFAGPHRHPHPPPCDAQCQEQKRLNQIHPAPAPTYGNPNVNPPSGTPKHEAP